MIRRSIRDPEIGIYEPEIENYYLIGWYDFEIRIYDHEIG